VKYDDTTQKMQRRIPSVSALELKAYTFILNVVRAQIQNATVDTSGKADKLISVSFICYVDDSKTFF
jgi:hypothetical protein